LHLKDNAGVLLANVLVGGPAARAGLEPGDVIQAINDRKIAVPRDFATNISAMKPGVEARLTLLRNGEVKEIALDVGEMPVDRVVAGGAATRPGRDQIGLTLAPLSAETRDRLDLPDSLQGALVQGVKPGSPAAQADMKQGDIVVAIGSQKVASPAETVRAIRAGLEGKDGTLAIRVFRDGHSIFVGIMMEQEDG
jgi:serine protease Do